MAELSGLQVDVNKTLRQRGQLSRLNTVQVDLKMSKARELLQKPKGRNLTAPIIAVNSLEPLD